MLLTVEIFHLTVFLFSRVSCRKTHIFSLIITRANIYRHLLVKLQKSCYVAALVEDFVSIFPETIFLHAATLVFQFFSSSIISHFHLYLFQPNLPSFFACSLIPVMTIGQAEKGKSKFAIRKEWDYMIISHLRN